MPIATLNPSTGATIRIFDEMSEGEIDRRLALAASAQPEWAGTPLSTRERILRDAAAILDDEQQRLAELMTLEMGKPVASSRAEIAKCASALRYYAERGAAFLQPLDVPLGKGERGTIVFEPLGVVLAVMPWNFPFWQVVRFAAPALMAGNGGVLKHASSVPQCALAIEEVFLRAGLPEGVFQTLLIGAPRVERVLSDRRVAAVTLTGSEAAGGRVASIAATHLKKSVLELGGSDPFIVMPSVDVRSTAEAAARARTINNGQSCIAAKRFLVHGDVAAEFESELTAAMVSLHVGDPMEESTDVGPLASEQVLAEVERQVKESVRQGAKVLTGGARLDRPGFYYPPTVLSEVPHDAPVCSEEVFGPVAPILHFPDAEAAVDLANSTEFGLGASVWTADEQEAEMFSNRLRAGMVFINAIVQSDPRLPFGGVKRSGYGRELGEYGMHEFMNVKTIRARAEPAEKS